MLIKNVNHICFKITNLFLNPLNLHSQMLNILNSTFFFKISNTLLKIAYITHLPRYNTITYLTLKTNNKAYF